MWENFLFVFLWWEKQQHVLEHQKVTANNKTRHLKLIILVFFYVCQCQSVKVAQSRPTL